MYPKHIFLNLSSQLYNEALHVSSEIEAYAFTVMRLHKRMLILNIAAGTKRVQHN